VCCRFLHSNAIDLFIRALNGLKLYKQAV